MGSFRRLSVLAQTYIAYRKRTEICSYPPTRVWVELTNHCNLRCSFCGNRLLAENDRGFMSLDLFKQLVDEASGKIRQFNLFHRGESLLHPQVGEMIGYANLKGIRTRLHTNGTVLTPDLCNEIINKGLDVISFSFDGYDKEMYERNRVGANFDCVLGNIISLLKAKKSSQSRKPFVVIEVMEITDLPADQVLKKRRQFWSFFNGLPLDKLVIRRPHNWAGLVEVEGSRMDGSRIPCPLLWHALVVFWDGKVVPCPQDFFGELQIGDAKGESLMECWNGEALRQLRQEMSRPDDLSRHPCIECDRIIRRTFAGIPVDYLGRFVSEVLFSNNWIGRILPH